MSEQYGQRVGFRSQPIATVDRTEPVVLGCRGTSLIDLTANDRLDLDLGEVAASRLGRTETDRALLYGAGPHVTGIDRLRVIDSGER